MGSPRPTDWSPLGLTGDPVPGNVDQIRNAADRHFRKVADLIVDQAARLRRIDASSDSEWDSESGRAFRDVSNDLAGAIDKAESRYRQVGQALETYATFLDGVQDEADRILGDAERAEQALRKAQYTIVSGEPGTPEYDEAKDDRQEAIDDAREALRIARGEIEALTGPGGAWSEANRVAVDAIRAAIDDEMADQWYDTIKQWIHDARVWLNAIKDILGVISMILAAVVLVIVLFIPGVNIVALLIIGVVLAAITFAITAAQWFAGDATTADLLWDGLGLVLSIVGLKFAGPIAANVSRMTNSAAHSAGQVARLAGGNYSAAYQAFKNGTPVLGALDEVLSGSVTLVRVAALPGAIPKVAAALFLPTALMSAATVAGDIVSVIDGAESVGDIGEVIFDFEGYIDNLDRVQVGSL